MGKSCPDKKNGGKILLTNFFVSKNKFFTKIILLQCQITFYLRIFHERDFKFCSAESESSPPKS